MQPPSLRQFFEWDQVSWLPPVHHRPPVRCIVSSFAVASYFRLSLASGARQRTGETTYWLADGRGLSGALQRNIDCGALVRSLCSCFKHLSLCYLVAIGIANAPCVVFLCRRLTNKQQSRPSEAPGLADEGPFEPAQCARSRIGKIGNVSLVCLRG